MAVSNEALARRYYDRGLWGVGELRRLVDAGKLSVEAYGRITGMPYAPDGMPDTEGMTKHELVEWATAHGVEAYESWSRDRIVAAIAAAVGEA